MHHKNRRKTSEITSLTIEGKRIGLLTTSASRLGGGVFEAVVQHTEMVKDLGGLPLVFALEDAFSKEDAGRFGNVPVSLSRTIGPMQIGYAPALLSKLREAELDCLHLHGIWQYPSLAAQRWTMQTGKAYVISPHGMLDPWITARGTGKKALARLGYERASWKAATRFHALTGREARDIANESGRTDCAIIPNAGPPNSAAAPAMPAPEILYLGRIHPKKNISALIEAWQDLGELVSQTDARLTIAGWGDAIHVAELQNQLENAPESIRFVGPAFGEAKEELLAGARFLVLPSMSEGLPMAVLEAWAKGKPVLMSEECNLPAGFEAGAAIDCGMSASAVRGALSRALKVKNGEWLKMSHAASHLASRKFSSECIAQQWAACYRASIDEAQNGKKLP